MTGERETVAHIVGRIMRDPHGCETDSKYDEQTKQESSGSLRHDGCGRFCLQVLVAGNLCRHRLILSGAAA